MSAQKASPRHPLAWPRKLALGGVFALGVFGLLLGGLELGLRLCDYGHSASFYRRETATDGSAWLRENRWVTAPFFAPELIRRPQVFRLPAHKAPGTYRIFVLGSSAAMGDPEASFSLARTLDALLRPAHPEIKFEIVNAGITAINSTVVRGIAADCAELEPDLFVVYEGNNEVIGPFGPGTVFTPFLGSPAAVRLAVFLKRSRTGQLLAATARLLGRDRSAPADWGGMGMFLEHGIAADDPRLATTRALFRDNLAAIAQSGRTAGAAVFLCTVVTNQRDCSPFLSLHPPGLDTAALARWQAAFDAGVVARDAGNHQVAATRFAEAAAIDDRHAETFYLLGRAQLETGDIEHGRASLQRALDLDALRFRTDSRLNSVIRSFATPQREGVRVIDLATRVGESSPDGLAGDESLYEHVHLNLRGTYRIARELCGPIEEDLRRRGLVPATTPEPKLPELPEIRHRLAYTVYEQAMIFREMLARFSRPPFAGQRDNDRRLASYRTMDKTASLLLQRPETPAALEQLYEEALAARPDDWMLRRNAGMAYVALGLAEKALQHLDRAVAIIPDDPDTLYALARTHQTLGHPAESARCFAQVRALEPRYPGLPDPK
jgi:tetratricopeptide (TPR) repeat protein